VAPPLMANQGGSATPNLQNGNTTHFDFPLLQPLLVQNSTEFIKNNKVRRQCQIL